MGLDIDKVDRFSVSGKTFFLLAEQLLENSALPYGSKTVHHLSQKLKKENTGNHAGHNKSNENRPRYALTGCIPVINAREYSNTEKNADYKEQDAGAHFNIIKRHPPYPARKQKIYTDKKRNQCCCIDNTGISGQ